MGNLIEAEQALACAVINGIDTVVPPGDFSSDAHRTILSAAVRLRNEGIKPDLVTINNRLEKEGNVDQAGGQDYLAKLSSATPPRNIQPIEEIVMAAALRKRIVAFGQSVVVAAESGIETEELLIKVQREPLSLDSDSNRAEIFYAHEVAFDVLDMIKDRRQGDHMVGVPTPFYALNEMTSGLRGGDLITLAGRPGMGKTALASQLATHCSQRHGAVFVGSLEMDKSSLVTRLISSEARVDSFNMDRGKVTSQEEERLQTVVARMQDYHAICGTDKPRLSAVDLRILMMQAHAKDDVKLGVIDYLGLMKDSGKTSRYLTVGENARIMRATARELDIPVILVAQLNRDCEKRDDKRPLLSDLRESGDIEQDSDVVLFLYRDSYYCNKCISGQPDEDCMFNHAGLAELLVRKQRKGPTGNVTLTWNPAYTRFENYTPRSEDEGS